MTLSISLVAVFCSSASVSSRFRACELLEEPHVLDGDDRLVREGPDQLDLTGRRKRPTPLPKTEIRRSTRPPGACGTAICVRLPTRQVTARCREPASASRRSMSMSTRTSAVRPPSSLGLAVAEASVGTLDDLSEARASRRHQPLPSVLVHRAERPRTAASAR